jgi:hypothetical protein
MGVKYKGRLVVELATQMACQKLFTLNRSHFKNLRCLSIIARFRPRLKLNIFEAFEGTDTKLVIELDIADNQCCTSLSIEAGKAEAG